MSYSRARLRVPTTRTRYPRTPDGRPDHAAARAEAQREEERADSRRYAAQAEQLRAQLAARDQSTN